MPAFSKEDIPKDWRDLLGEYLESPAWQNLESRLQTALDTNNS